MSKDLEDSTEKLLGSQRKGSQLNAAKESKDIFERPKKQNTQTNFDKRCQSLITKQTKVFIDIRQALSFTHHQANHGIY